MWAPIRDPERSTLVGLGKIIFINQTALFIFSSGDEADLGSTVRNLTVGAEYSKRRIHNKSHLIGS